MKTKTDSFSKFITFCVLALFLFTNMILFSSCDNGNSPNDNTNEEQNNNAPTDYCEICDGVQIENCGIEHKCNDENCVEYADKKIYKNGHTHDYCERTDCDGSTHMGADHPTDTSWFKETPIGGEDSPYKALCIDSIKYNEANPDTTEVERFNNYQNQYKSFIEGLEFSDEFIKQFPEIKNINFAEFAEYNVNDKISYKESFDQLINNINNACAPVFDSITKNIKISDDADIDKKLMLYYYNAMKNEAENGGASGGDINNANYNAKKASIDATLQRFNTAKGTNFSIYEKTTNANGEIVYGEILPEVVDRLELMFDHAANNLNIDRSDIENAYNISLCGSSAEGLHDALSDITHEISPNDCATNEMSSKIGSVDLELIVKAPTKLNKSIFSQDYGHELC